MSSDALHARPGGGEAHDVTGTQGGLRSLRQVMRAIRGLAEPDVLRRAVTAARELVGAQYAAIGVAGPSRGLTAFVYDGMDPTAVAGMGHPPQGRGLLGALLEDPVPLRLARLADDPRAVGLPAGHPPMEGFLGVPIWVRDELFGAFCVVNASRGEFTAEDEELLAAFATSVGDAIDSARLHEASRTRRRWLAASTQISRQLLSTGPNAGRARLQLIAERTQQLADADLVLVLRVPEPAGDALAIEVSVGADAAHLRGRTLPVAGSLSGRVLTSAEPVRVAQLSDGTGLPAITSDEVEVGPLLVVPLPGSAQVHGVLVAGRLVGRPRFTDTDLQMAAGFADHAALALELAEARRQQQPDELRALVAGYAPSDAGPAGEAASAVELVAANVGDMISTADAQGRFEWVSPSSALLTGWAAADLVGQSIFELVHPDDEPLLRARWAEQVAGAPLVGVEYRHRRPDGSYQWVETRIRPLHGPGGRVTGSVASVRDVSERHRLQAELAEALETFELSFAAAPIGKALVAADGRWLKVNPALSAILGRTAAQLLAGTAQGITHTDDLEAQLDLAGQVLRGERDGYQVERRYLRPDGREVWVQLNVAGARRSDGSLRFFIVQVQDISRRRADAQTLQQRADHDPLTGLWNRRRFADALTACYGRGRRARDRPVLLVLDLDGFKAINDTHGHAVGDLHLQQVAAVLRESVRGGDGCGRLGGDEFAVLLADADPCAAAEIAERISQRVTALGRGGVSIGVTPWTPTQDVDRWLAEADRAMYQVKAGARS